MAFQYEDNYPVNTTILTRPFEKSAIESRDGGGGKRFDYIAAETCIRRLNEATGNRWSFGLAPGSFIQFLDGGNDRNGNPENVMLATCELTIPGLGTRQGIGVQRVKMPMQNGEDMMKGVLSDALKKCATLFGVALELYGPELDIPAEEAPRNRGGVRADEVALARQAQPPPPMRLPATRARGSVQQETPEERDAALAKFGTPATRTRPEPNGPEVQRQKIREAAAAKDILLPEDGTSAEWADALDRLFEILDSDFRVDRLADGSVTARALQSAILAVPAKVTA